MTFSKPILATAPNTVKMNWWQYWISQALNSVALTDRNL